MHSAPPLKFILRHTCRAIRPVLSGGLLLFAVVFASAQNAAPQYFFSHLAGPPGGFGNADGPGPAAARFNSPSGVVADRAGNVYVTDSFNCTVRKISPNGVVTTLAGTAGVFGTADGTGVDAQFYLPTGMAMDGVGNIYIVDSANDRIRKITPAGVVTTIATIGSATPLSYHGDLAVDSAGNIYLADTGSKISYTSLNGSTLSTSTDFSLIHKISPDGVVTVLAGSATAIGSTDGTGSAALFNEPAAKVADSAGNLYVVDSNTIRRISPGGAVTTLAGLAGAAGYADGIGSTARFNGPAGLAVDSAGNVYVADAGNEVIRKINSSGLVTTLAGLAAASGYADGFGSAARFKGLSGMTTDSAGNVYVADEGNDAIRKITADGTVTTLAGLPGESGYADGLGSAARFNLWESWGYNYYPSGVAVDSKGNVYVADTNNDLIRKITPVGVVTTLAGAMGIQDSADGTGQSAHFFRPEGVAVDNAGNVYVADTGNETIRRITSSGVVTTLAGLAGGNRIADGVGSAAEFFAPVGVAVDGTGNVYVTDSSACSLRKITSDGVVSTLAGSFLSPGSADGTGASAQFLDPRGVSVDGLGNIYVADSGNHTIRKVTSSGVVTTVAGLAGQSGRTDGSGSAARFNSPQSLAADDSGNLYVADTGNHTIRKVTPNGVVTTIGSMAGIIGSADGIGPGAQFNFPAGMAVDSTGSLYVADRYNNAIRKGQIAGPPMIATQPLSQTVIRGGSVQFSVVAGGIPAPTYQWYFNGGAFDGANTNTLSFTGVRGGDAGNYTVVVTNSLGSVTSTKATLTVSSAPVTPTPTSASSSGGGGSIESWFALGLLSLAALNRCSKQSSCDALTKVLPEAKPAGWGASPKMK